jgi:hypothetical protein
MVAFLKKAIVEQVLGALKGEMSQWAFQTTKS